MAAMVGAGKAAVEMKTGSAIEARRDQDRGPRLVE
jgi:hypothetical protein